MDKFTRRDFIRTLGVGSAGLFLTGLPGQKRLLFGNTPFEKKQISELAAEDEYDVCIVGSGPAGAILASKLASFKIRTLLLESGYNPYNTTPVPGLGELDAYSSSGDRACLRLQFLHCRFVSQSIYYKNQQHQAEKKSEVELITK